MQRRNFLTASAAGTVLAAVETRAAAVAAPQTAPSAAPWTFDRGAFEAVLDRPARHRQVFASTALEGGMVLHYMQNSLHAYDVGFGEGPGTLHAAAVLYGTSLFAAVDDAMWAKYKLAAFLAELPKPEHLEASLQKNPHAPQLLALVRDANASFFVCNNAFTGLTAAVATKTPGANRAAVYDELRAHFLGGAMLVPAGVAALNAAQEARFTLIQATLG